MPSAKVVLVGTTGVGKTCICERLTKDQFTDSAQPTIGAANFSVCIDTDKGKVELNVWDTAGQEKYRSLAPMYFANSHAAILVFDLTSEESLTSLDSYYDVLVDRAPKDCVFVLVGNKADMTEARTILKETAENYAAKIGAAFYCETSAFTGEGIKELFTNLASLPSLSTVDDEQDYISAPTVQGNTKKDCC